MRLSAVSIAQLKSDGGIADSDWRSLLMVAADAAGDHDGRIDCAELDAYLRNPKDHAFVVPGGAQPNALAPVPRLTDEGLAALRSRIAEKTGEADELRIVPHRGQPGVSLLRTYSRGIYDGDKRIPAIVGYVLSSPDVGEEHFERNGNFREDPLLDPGLRASVTDYRNSGMDEGHMRPAEDSPNAEAMHESFLLSNAVPQTPALNRVAWKDLEAKIRDLVRGSGGRAVIFTGSLFLDDKGHPMKGPVPRIHGRVASPTHCFKAVLLVLPDGHATMFGFVIANDATHTTGTQALRSLFEQSRRSIDAIEQLSGFDIFGDVPAAIQKPMKASATSCPVLPANTSPAALHAASLLFPPDCAHEAWTMPAVPGAASAGWATRFATWLGSWI